MSNKYKLQKLLRETYAANHVNYDNIATSALDDIVSIVNLTNIAFTVAAQPDVPRNVIITIVDTTPGITAGLVTVIGVDACGRLRTELHDCSAGAGTYTGSIPFATITSIKASNFATLGGAGNETIKVGSGTKIGLPCQYLRDVFKACIDGANETIGTENTTYGTIIPTTAPNGTRDFDFWYNYYLVPLMA